MKNPLDDKPELSAWVKQQDVDAIDNFVMEMNWRQLSSLRGKQKLGQRAIADAIGVSVPTYSKIENGKQMPSRAQAVNLAGAFGFKGSVIDLAAALDQELRDVMEQSSWAALDRLKRAKQQNHALEANSPTMAWTAPEVTMTVNRKRIPFYTIVDKPRVFSIEQTVQIIPDEAELITTPPMLAGIDDAYAMIVPNHLMHPAYGEGDTVFVHTGRIPQNGDDVVVRLTFEDREIAFIRSIWDTNARDSKEGEEVFFDLISYAQRDIAKMHAAAQVGDPEDLGAIVELAAKLLKDNYWSLVGYEDGRNVIAGTGLALPKITDATVDVIVGCQRKMGNEYGRGKFGSGPYS